MFDPSGVLLVVLVTGVIFVNGFTDAPNAITGIVVTKSMTYGGAVRLAALCNLLGIALMGLLNASVAQTILSLANFSAADSTSAVCALCAAMLTIILFAVGAWYFGIPTSESHALIAALGGASAALGGAFDTTMLQGWGKVLAGLAMSLAAGFCLGFGCYRFAGRALSRLPGSTLGGIQIAGAGAMAFMHGAQDGQKFAAVFIMAELLAVGGDTATASFALTDHLPALLLCALVMAVGTGMGGRRIIDNVGGRMVSMDRVQAACSDFGGTLCLLAASLTGIPMSTTHTKTTAIMGAGAAKRNGGTNKHIIGSMFLAWGITFPVCGLLGYLFTGLLCSFL